MADRRDCIMVLPSEGSRDALLTAIAKARGWVATIASCDDFVAWSEHHLDFLRKFAPSRRSLRALAAHIGQSRRSRAFRALFRGLEPRFEHIKTLVRVLNRTERTDRCTFDERLYISSAPLDIEQIANGGRGHRGVESKHWLLDIDRLAMSSWSCSS